MTEDFNWNDYNIHDYNEIVKLGEKALEYAVNIAKFRDGAFPPTQEWLESKAEEYLKFILKPFLKNPKSD